MAPRPTESASTASATLSSTVENYLKHLYAEQHDAGRGLLPMGRLAQALGVTPGTATTMVKALADSGLVKYEPRDGVKLTAAGERHALNVIRRHRLVELFLVRMLGLDWSEVHEEAEELEHAISDKVLDKIDKLLGHPQFDPHGDPIPGAKGQLTSAALTSLAECELHEPMRIARVTGQDAAFLQTLHRLGLTPGTQVVVEARDKLADSVTIRPKGQPVTTLGTTAASKILVERR
jgi:DtxR family transcriptional regulator, Mn-dependent transcriptional regulator